MSAPPSSAPAAATRGDRTRAAILGAARRRFAEHGFDRTRLAEIAADAGVAEPTVAFHFGSKSGLLVAVMRAEYDGLVREIEEVVAAPAAPEARLSAFARYWVHTLDERSDLIAVFGSQGRLGHGGAEFAAAFADCNRRVTRVFERLVQDLKAAGVLAAGVPARILRDAFFGTTEHLLLGRALTGRPADLDRAADDVLALLRHGAAAPRARAARTGPTLATLDAKLDELLARSAPADRA
jgi:TetR/AcrR family transcriptional regulator, fatty acid metabolism regulator protein